MDLNIDNLKRLIERVNNLSFWERLFNWKSLKSMLIDASSDLQKLVSNIDSLKDENGKQSTEIEGLRKDIKLSDEKATKLEAESQQQKNKRQELDGLINQLDKDIVSKDATINNQNLRVVEVTAQNNTLTKENTKLDNDNKQLSETRAINDETISNQKNKITELESTIKFLTEGRNKVDEENKQLSKVKASNDETIAKLTERKNELELEVRGLRLEKENLSSELVAANEKNVEYATVEDTRRDRHDQEIAAVVSVKNQIQEDRQRELEERNRIGIDRLNKLKETWSKHQENAKQTIKAIANKHTIEYVDKVPFKGDPDNTLKICDEFVIFDAKSPASDDLNNFPTYLNAQAESVKKYAKQENVKPDIFFVVPSNTLQVLTKFVYNLPDYNVFVVSVDSLEPIILSLKKIEEYEFAEQLSPEDRDNICRVLGRFAHLTKRRIQIDNFFASQFIELAYKSETALPKDFHEKMLEYEKSEKLNPPMEKRAKAINTKELDKDSQKLKREAIAKGITIDDEKISDGINLLQLYKSEQDVIEG